MLTEIEEGEQGFRYDEAAEDDLRKRMGLPRRSIAPDADTATPREADKAQAMPQKRAGPVGHRPPVRDPVKGAKDPDGKASERIV
jgi:hypothetical protein